jgi:hypothetical protein
MGPVPSVGVRWAILGRDCSAKTVIDGRPVWGRVLMDEQGTKGTRVGD